MRLALEMEVAVRGFPRYHKYTLGTELRYDSPFSCPYFCASGFTATVERCNANRGQSDATARQVQLPKLAYYRSVTRSNSMKIPEFTFRYAACAMLALFSPWSLAQTCVAGIQASNPSSVYVINSVLGTVTDSRTGLMWDRCALGQSGPGCATGAASYLSWQAALDAAATVGTYKGYNDWRLPNLKELRSLVEECRINPSINEFAFPNTPTAIFYSGSPFAADANGAWSVYFGWGGALGQVRGSAYQVRLVRAGH